MDVRFPEMYSCRPLRCYTIASGKRGFAFASYSLTAETRRTPRNQLRVYDQDCTMIGEKSNVQNFPYHGMRKHESMQPCPVGAGRDAGPYWAWEDTLALTPIRLPREKGTSNGATIHDVLNDIIIILS